MRIAAGEVASWMQYVVATSSVLGALLLIDMSAGILSGGGVFLLLLMPVMVSAIVGGAAPGLVALFLGAAGSVLLVPLRGHPWLSEAADVGRLALYLSVGSFTILLTAAFRGALRETTIGPRRRPDLQSLQPTGLPDPLTPREVEILRLAGRGLSTDAIGNELYLSRNTVKSHLAHAYAKLGAHNRAEAISAGILWGYIDPEALIARLR